MDSADGSTGAEDSSGEGNGERFQTRPSLFQGSSSQSSSSLESSKQHSTSSGSRQRKHQANENKEVASTPAKSSSMKRQIERQDKEASEFLHKRRRKTGKLKKRDKAASEEKKSGAEEEDPLDNEEAVPESNMPEKLEWEDNENDIQEVKSKSQRKRKKKADALVDRSGKEKFAWNAKDEIVMLNRLAECAETGNPMPRTAVLNNQVKSLLENDYSDNQLNNKLKNFRRKFKENMEKKKDSSFQFKSPHEKNVFLLSKKIWGNEKKNETTAKRNRNGGRDNNVADKEEEEEEEENEKEKNDDDEIELNTEEDEKLDTDKADPKLGKDSAAHESNGEQEDILLNVSNGELKGGEVKVSSTWFVDLVKNVVKENMDNLKEFYKEMFKENNETMSKHKNELLVENQHMANRMIESNRRFSSSLGSYSTFQFSGNEMIPSFSSLKSMELPPLKDFEVKELKQKWLEQEAVEIEANIKRLALFQEELEMKLRKLRPTKSNISS